MIEIRNLRKSFGSTQALNDVNLTVPTGTVYGLVGPNGAGKSTLIQHITGIYRPDAGTILVDDVPVFDNPEVKRKIFCIYDDIYYYMYATTRDLKRFYQGLYPNFDEKRYEALREAFPEIKDNQPLRSLSKGMLKQSAFWLALCCRPEILVLDDVCDHVGILHKGKVLLEQSLSDLQDSVSKIQVLFEGDPPEQTAELEVLHCSNTGRMRTYIVRGNHEAALQRFSAYNPLYLEALPLTLEEIFIYELGGASYEVQDILL